MQNPFQPNLRKPWILLCASLLLVYTIMPGERGLTPLERIIRDDSEH